MVAHRSEGDTALRCGAKLVRIVTDFGRSRTRPVFQSPHAASAGGQPSLALSSGGTVLAWDHFADTAARAALSMNPGLRAGTACQAGSRQSLP